MTAMLTETDLELMTAPSIEQPFCCVCGRAPVEHHHVVNRARTMKSKDNRGPTIPLCRKCHARHHSVTPFRFSYGEDGWKYDGKPCHTAYIEGA